MLSSPDSELCRRDPALPGLRLLLDPDALLERVEAMGERMPVQSASPSYLRYKPGTNCLVGFSANSESQICFYGKVFPPGSSKLRSRHGSTPVGGHRVVISDEGIELVFFPADNKLALAPAFDPGLLSRLKPEGESPHLSDDSVSSTVLAYRPERRCVIAVGYGDRTVGVVKAYAAREFPASAARVKALSDESPKTPPLAVVDSANRLLFFPWTPGRLLQRSIEDRTISADDLYAAGAAPAELHARPVRSLPIRGKAAEARSLRAIASMVGRLCPNLHPLALRLAERMIEGLDFMDWNEATLHGDFGAKQVVVDNGRAALIDLDEAATGNGAIDLGNFTARMEADALLDRIMFEHIPSSRSALMAGYVAMKKLPGEAELVLATAIGLFRVAHEPFRSHVPDWPERMRSLLHRVNAMLEGMPLQFSEYSAAGSLS